MNLKDLGGIQAMKEMAYAAAELAHKFGGVMSGEHGDGLQRSELNEVIFGPELYQAMRQFKSIFDPRGLINPGKRSTRRPWFQILRYGSTYSSLKRISIPAKKAASCERSKCAMAQRSAENSRRP